MKPLFTKLEILAALICVAWLVQASNEAKRQHDINHRVSQAATPQGYSAIEEYRE